MGESAAASLLQPFIDAVVKEVGAVVKRQCKYLCCFSSNIASLEKEVNELDVATRDLQKKVEGERNNGQDIGFAVENWLTYSNDFKGNVDGILNGVPHVKSGCFMLCQRYSLSKKATKATQAMKEHREKIKEFDGNGISHPKPPAATIVNPSVLEYTYEFMSRKEIEDKIMSCFKGENKDMVGICGMGGLGKTTMAKKIRNRALEEVVFEEVVMAVVSQQVDMSKIQLQIAEQLGLELKKETSFARANELCERLNDTKRTLVILDDVWESLDLEELGIPCGFEGCKILFVSVKFCRGTSICLAMYDRRCDPEEIA